MCSIPVFNKHAPCKKCTQQGQNRDIFGGLCFVLLAFLQCLCLLIVELAYSRLNSVFRKPKLRNNFIFEMLHCFPNDLPQH